MKLVKYKIVDVCDIQIGKTPRREVAEYWGKGYSWVSISDLKEKEITETKEQITQNGVDDCGCKLITKGTLLLSFKLSIGKLAFAGKDLFTNEAIAALPIKCPDVLHPDYLYYVLKHVPLLGSNNAVMGATLNKESLKKINIPVPEKLQDQIRIADILSRTESLITKRKESIRLLDDLAKSVFLDLFGDIIYSRMNSEEIGKLTNFIDYRGKTPEREEGGIPFISAKCVRRGYFDEDRLDYISSDTYNKIMTRGFPKANDVLFTTEGATMGYTCRIPKHFNKFAIGQRIITIRCNDRLLPEYLDYLLNHEVMQKEVIKNSSGSAAIGIRAAEFKEIKIPIPPIELQNMFATVVEKVEATKVKYRESLFELEALYGSLTQRAFRGEL